MRKIFVLLLGVLLLATLADVTPANTGIKEYEQWPEEGQVIALQDDDDNWQLYEIKDVRLDAEGGLKYANCLHLFNELADGPPRMYTLTNATPATSMAEAVIGTRWEVGDIDASLTALTVDFVEDYSNPLEFLRIIERDYSARLSFRVVVADHEVTNLYIDLLEIDEEFKGQRFEFGHNLKNINIIVDRDGIKTALVGLGIGDEVDLDTDEPKYLTFENEVAADKPAGQDWIGDEEARMAYGIPDSTGTMMHRYGIYRSDAKTPATLLTATRVQVRRQSTPKVTVEADVGDLEKVKIVDIATGNLVTLDHEKIRLNNICQVIAKSKGLLAAVELKISRVEKPLKERDKTKVTFGDPIALGSDKLKALEDEMIWKDKRRRQLDRGRGPATVTVASEDSSYSPYYANVVVPSSATNAQVYINQAIAMLPARGGRVILLDGLYVIDGSIILPDNVSLEGQGEGTVIQKSTFGANIRNDDIVTSGNTGLKIKDLKIDGNNLSNYGIYIRLSSNIEISSVYVENVGDGISLSAAAGIYSCSNVTVANNKIIGNADGIYIGGSSGVAVVGNISKNNTSYGITLYDSEGVISSNIVDDNAGGVRVLEIDSGSVADVSITGNSCSGNTAHGIYVTANTGAYDFNISGNVCSENEDSGIYLSAFVFRNSIQNNKCHNNTDYGIAIAAASCEDNLVTNNDLTGNTAGSLLDSGTGTITAAGNRV